MVGIRAGAVALALTGGCASGAGEDDGREPSAASITSTDPGSSGEPVTTHAADASGGSGEPVSPTTGDATTQAADATSTGDAATDTGGTASASGTGELTSGESTDAAPACGDGALGGPDEACDDGNAVDGDGCNADCQPSGRLLWSTTHGGGRGLADDGVGCAVDGTGSIYVSGSVGVAEGDDNLWVRKYAATGEPLWTHEHAGSAKLKDQGRGLIVDPAELVYVAGFVNTALQGNDAFVRKFAADGIPVWTKGFNGAAMLGDVATGAALTPTGDVVVGGASAVDGAGNDTWLRKYTPTGTVAWTRSHGGASKGHDETNAIAVTADGYIYAAGAETVTGEARNIWIGKYDPDGNQLWARLYNGGASKDDYLYGVVAMDDGGVVVCGYETAVDIPWKSFIRRYDAAGLVTWTEIDAGPELAGAVCYGVTLASNGDLLIAGAAIEGSTREPRLRRMTPDGAPRWSTVIAGAGAGGSQARCVRQALDGTLIATGSQDDGADSRDIWVARFSQ